MSFCLSEMRSSILITGCGDSDVALALAEKFSTLGHEVIITQKAEVYASEVHPGCSHIVRLQADVSTEYGRQQLRAHILNDHPQVNVLIHTTCHVKLMPPLAETLNVDWEATKESLNTDLMALVHLSTLFLPHLIRHSSHGLFVSVGSISDFQSLQDYPLYHAMKAASHSFLKSMRLQLINTTRVSVVEVSPPCLETRHDTVSHDRSVAVDADVFAHSVFTQLLLGRTEIGYQTDGKVPHN